jgi:hypothetical protein
MLVYRIETYKGRGVYKSPHYDTSACYGDRHPAPEEDGLPEEFHWSYQFGFQSLAHLKAWFDLSVRELWANYMKKNDDLEPGNYLYVSVYDVPSDMVMFGGRQMIFIKEAATLISRKLVDSLNDAVLVN